MINKTAIQLFACLAALHSAHALEIDYYRLQAPGDNHAIEQASDLHYGKLMNREGLWLVCDRNGGDSAGKIYFISADTLKDAKPGNPIIADLEISIIAPVCWSQFDEVNREAGQEVLEDLKRRTVEDANRSDEPYLDLEAITIAPSILPPHEPHLFVVTEEPYSAVLELNLIRHDSNFMARPVGVYVYNEILYHQGTAKNDGLEGLAYAGKPGEFFFVEEGTHSHTETAKPLLMFRDPLLGRAKLEKGKITTDEPNTAELCKAVQAQRQGPMQTLNALTVLPDGQVLAVDRNGGWILRVDSEKKTSERWLNLYDLNGTNLREVLAHFPGDRHMPYISIEGIALDAIGNIWLVDDPAMPEAFHVSCLIRLRGLNLAQSQPASRGTED